MALGAFLGGLILAEGEFSHQAHAEIRPLRDILAGLFFISLGMLADFSTIVPQLPLVLGVTLVLIVVKAVVAGGALWVVSTPLRVAATAGIGLAQVGEFSFILGRSGLDVGLLSSRQWQVLLAASIVTMVVSPALVAFAPGTGRGCRRKPCALTSPMTTAADQRPRRSRRHSWVRRRRPAPRPSTPPARRTVRDPGYERRDREADASGRRVDLLRRCHERRRAAEGRASSAPEPWWLC